MNVSRRCLNVRIQILLPVKTLISALESMRNWIFLLLHMRNTVNIDDMIAGLMTVKLSVWHNWDPLSYPAGVTLLHEYFRALFSNSLWKHITAFWRFYDFWSVSGWQITYLYSRKLVSFMNIGLSVSDHSMLFLQSGFGNSQNISARRMAIKCKYLVFSLVCEN